MVEQLERTGKSEPKAATIAFRRQNRRMLLGEVAATWRDVAGTPSRTAKTLRVAETLRAAGADVAIVVPWLGGELRQRRTGIGWAALRDAPPPAAEATLSVAEVDATFERAAALSGPGSQSERARLVRDLFARATAGEQALLRGLISGELRQGALDAVVTDALARVVGAPLADVRRAVMLAGAVAPVAVAALQEGPAALDRFRLTVGRPLQPMLAATAASVAEALDRHGGEVLVDAKLDGVRIQVHKDGSDVAAYTRSLDDMTARVPEIVAAVRALPARTLVLDGEALAVGAGGRPLPFQETGARAATRSAAPVPLSLFAFDLLHLDGEDHLEAPLRERAGLLGRVAPGLVVPRTVTADVAAAEAFNTEILDRGHEGVVVKALDAGYEAGRRGGAWLKVKPVRTVDLVVLAAEWGHGRRTGWLSNLHLGARDPGGGGFVMVGKTFKGLTDDLLRWQTEQLLAREVRRERITVHVEPSLVVEIGFDGVQRSPRYPGGLALRFARVLRYRDDKPAAEADLISDLQALLPG